MSEIACNGDGSFSFEVFNGPEAYGEDRRDNEGQGYPGEYLTMARFKTQQSEKRNKYHNLLQTIAKRLETLAIFPVISDILIINTHLPPSPLINVVMDLVMTSNKQQH